MLISKRKLTIFILGFFVLVLLLSFLKNTQLSAQASECDTSKLSVSNPDCTVCLGKILDDTNDPALNVTNGGSTVATTGGTWRDLFCGNLQSVADCVDLGNRAYLVKSCPGSPAGVTGLSTGSACQPNLSDCSGVSKTMGRPYINLYALADKASYSDLINSDYLKQAIKTKYGNDYTRECVDARMDSFITRWMDNEAINDSTIVSQNLGPVDSSQDGLRAIFDLKIFGDNATNYAVPRVCPAGWHISKGPNSVPSAFPTVAGVYGCCPVGFSFINVSSDLLTAGSNGLSKQAGACCRDGTEWNYWIGPSGDDPGGCVAKNSSLNQCNNTGSHRPVACGFQNDAQPQLIDNTLSGMLNQLSNNSSVNVITVIKDTGNGFSTKNGDTGNWGAEKNLNDPSDIKPQFGLGLGLSFPGQPVIKDNTPKTSADEVCNNSTGCALVVPSSPDSGNIKYNNPATNRWSTYNVVPAENLLNDSSLSCFKCFDNQEPIEVDSTNKKLLRCDPTAADGIKRDDLLNGSVDQTVACTKSDPTNNAACKACLQSGGIWLANGCVDTTPTGIVTGLIRLALGVMGGVALLQLIFAAIMMQSGDEAKIKEARQRVIATITGIALLVFSVLILRVLGVNVLDILPKNFV